MSDAVSDETYLSAARRLWSQLRPAAVIIRSQENGGVHMRNKNGAWVHALIWVGNEELVQADPPPTEVAEP